MDLFSRERAERWSVLGEGGVNLADLPSNSATIICSHVFDAVREVRLVTWDDTALCMLCGEEDHDWDNSKEARVVGVGHLFARQPELKTLSLEIGQEAEKTADRQWSISDTKDDT